MTVRVIARAIARPEARKQVQQALLAMIAPTRGEGGCLRYELTQNTADENEFVMLEEWRSEADLAAHLQAPHTAALLASLPPLLASPPDIRSYRALPVR